MTTLSIPLSDERLAVLRALANEAGLSPEDLLRQQIERYLDQPAQEFSNAAEYVLRKNAELYRRLA